MWIERECVMALQGHPKAVIENVVLVQTRLLTLVQVPNNLCHWPLKKVSPDFPQTCTT